MRIHIPCLEVRDQTRMPQGPHIVQPNHHPRFHGTLPFEVLGVFFRHFCCFANPERSSWIHRRSLGYWWGGSSLLSSSFSFPELLVGFPKAHPSLLPLFLRVRGR